ncbi:MAG: sugar ABC transporter substrate-binding protein [Spirochaetaceae bacterium]|nr:MAG: sugar ABC transporter substrate-binding protein [Spirochaetaceae bacterium]
MNKFMRIAVVLSCIVVLVSGVAFAGGAREQETVSINIALPNNPLSVALANLAETEYTPPPGVDIDISVIPENDLRQRLTTEASTGGTTFHMFTFGPYEALNWARFGWLADLEPLFTNLPADRRAAYDRADLIPAMADSLKMDGNAYALPFYGESAFIMYNKDLFEQNGLTMPERPTWNELYELAQAIHDPDNGIVGMTMRGAPGWGMSGAPFVPMVNAFGGRFFDTDWNATVDTPEQRAAWQKYRDILVNAGQDDIISYTYNEAIALMQSGRAGIYFDATSIAPPLESAESQIAGRVGYAFPPREQHVSQWLWNWAFGINPNITQREKEAVFDFMLWATSKEFIARTMEIDPTGASTPPASRSSTYRIPAYAAVPYAQITLDVLEELDFDNPTVDPVPYQGLQYIAIPEFADIGTQMTQWLADYVVGEMSLDDAIRRTQELFDRTAIEGGYR